MFNNKIMKRDKHLNVYENDILKITESFLMSQLAELDKEYKKIRDRRVDDYAKKIPEVIRDKRKEFKGLTDSEIKDKAINTIGDYSQQDYLNSIEDKRAKLLQNKESLSDDNIKQIEALDSKYKQLKEVIDMNMYGKGLNHSSIKTGLIDKAETSKMQESKELGEDLKGDLSALDEKLEKLEKEKENSLEAFDIKYAKKLDSEIEKLKRQREKDFKNTEKYNSNLEKKQENYSKNRDAKIKNYKDKIADDDKERKAFFNKNGYYPDMEDEYKERYKLAYDFYSNVSPKSAIKILNENPNLEKYLGKKYFHKLKTIIVMSR